MIITNVGTDYIRIDEDNINDKKLLQIPRVHLIKLNFFKPTELKVQKVLSLYKKTNRFVVQDYIKTYNYILKNTNKKYYVENSVGADIITFFKKNNKVLVNFNNFTEFEKQFLLSNCFEDILRNTEVIIIDQDVFEEKQTELTDWSGNVVIYNGEFN